MYKILCVEDDVKYKNLLVEELRKEGFSVDGVTDPIKALELLAKNNYDILISDLKLSVMDGTRLIESAKNIQSHLKTIILTGDPDENSELAAIHTNVDVYLEKAKSFTIILGYVNSLIEESNLGVTSDFILFSKSEEIELNVKEHKVTKHGEDVHLTPKEYELLKMFLSGKNELFTREEILEVVWPENNGEVDIRSVDTHIKKLRDKIKTYNIMTVRGYGYRWNEIEENTL